MKLTVIVSDFGAAANVGGVVETKTKTFEMPADVAAYIASKRGACSAVGLAFEDDDTESKQS